MFNPSVYEVDTSEDTFISPDGNLYHLIYKFVIFYYEVLLLREQHFNAALKVNSVACHIGTLPDLESLHECI